MRISGFNASLLHGRLSLEDTLLFLLCLHLAHLCEYDLEKELARLETMAV